MNEQTLRLWALGQLSPARRREVSRWLVRCTDPTLGPLLHGILQEARDAQADQRLAARGAAWGALVAAWGALLETGQAALASATEPPLVLAAAGADEEPEPLVVIGDPRAPQARLTLAEGTLAVVYLTDDSGAAQVLRAAGPAARGSEQIPIPAQRGPRATIWAIWGTSLPTGSGDPLDALAAAASAATTAAQAVRLVEAS